MFCLSGVMIVDVLFFSGEGSRYSDNSEDRIFLVMVRAVIVYFDIIKVMYFV